MRNRSAATSVLLLAIFVAACVLPALAGYTVQSSSASGAVLQFDGKPGRFGNDVQQLSFTFYPYERDIVRIRIADANATRWEVPWVVLDPYQRDPPPMPKDALYQVLSAPTGSSFFFEVLRSDTRELIFSGADLTFEDQYLELSTLMDEPDAYIYGLGERVHPLRLNPSQTYTLFAKDQGTPPDLNLYGSHPFYMQLRGSGNAHGVFLLNSNDMDVQLQPGRLTYRVVGGVLDLFFFVGPRPGDVVEQYTRVIGRPHMPPYWGLGFHQCRWGYNTLTDVETVVQQYAAHELPLDTMWTDIDYMDGYRDFTFDPQRYPADQVSQFVAKLHSKFMHYIPIVDPGIKNDPGYFAYQELLASGAYIRNATGSPFAGRVWPGAVIYPDFASDAAASYWSKQIERFHDIVQVDGLWIDMNEASNFCNGECPPSDDDGQSSAERLSTKSFAGFDPNNPPYVPGNEQLDIKTLSMDAVHSVGEPWDSRGLSIEYNLHNLFGYLEGRATRSALESIRGSRSMVISRSTFPGSGYQNGHWLGDNDSTFVSMAQSIPGLLNFQMFGIPLVGADICGFSGNTTEELCTRWMQLGAFYPFSRNHNSVGQQPQEPYVFSAPALDAMRAALNTRYTLLPFLYTLFAQAHSTGATVARPLFFEFPADPNCRTLDTQFLWGSGLMVVPALTEGQTQVKAYFPAGVWYDLFTTQAVSSTTGTYASLDAPLNHINVFVHGGSVIPTQPPAGALTTAEARQQPFALLVALGADGSATGTLYLDDGESLSMEGVNSTVLYRAASSGPSAGSLTATVQFGAFKPANSAVLGSVLVVGAQVAPSVVNIAGLKLIPKQPFATTAFQVTGLALPVVSAWQMTWQ